MTDGLGRRVPRLPANRGGILAQGVALVAIWAVLLGVVIGVGLLLTGPLNSSVGDIDRHVEGWFVAQRASWLTSLAEVASGVGSTVAVLVVGLLAAVTTSALARSIRPLVFLVIALGGELVLYLISVEVVSRHRPRVPQLDPGLDPTHSYPSGHTAAATVLYVGVAVLVRRELGRWRAIALIACVLPPVVAVARLYQGAHNLSDVLVAFALGLAWLTAVASMVEWPSLSGRRTLFPTIDR